MCFSCFETKNTMESSNSQQLVQIIKNIRLVTKKKIKCKIESRVPNGEDIISKFGNLSLGNQTEQQE